MLVESPFRGHFESVPIEGVPDAVCFKRGRPVYLLDYKHRAFRTSPELFPSDEVQLQLYGWLLEQNGFNTGELVLAGVFFPPTAQIQVMTLTQTQRRRIALLCWQMLEELISSAPSGQSRMHHPFWAQSDIPMIKGTAVTLVAVRCDPAQAEAWLDWAVPYWQGRRTPIPTTEPRKCARCRVNEAQLCSKALAPYLATV